MGARLAASSTGCGFAASFNRQPQASQILSHFNSTPEAASRLCGNQMIPSYLLGRQVNKLLHALLHDIQAAIPELARPQVETQR